MPYLVFDTETTDLCDFNRPAHAEGQPRLASWAMMFVDDDLQVTEGWHGLVKPGCLSFRLEHPVNLMRFWWGSRKGYACGARVQKVPHFC